MYTLVKISQSQVKTYFNFEVEGRTPLPPETTRPPENTPVPTRPPNETTLPPTHITPGEISTPPTVPITTPGVIITPPTVPVAPPSVAPVTPHSANPELNRIKFLENVLRDGTATNGQKAMLESYNRDPMAPEEVHYFRSLKGNGDNLTAGQEAYLKSYNANPRAPSFVHYFAQLMVQGEKLNPAQEKLSNIYKQSRIKEAKPKLEMPRY